MKAAVVHEYGAPLRIDEVADARARPGEVLVKVETSGLCHTDIHAAHGDWPVKPPLSIYPRTRGRRDRLAGRPRRHRARRATVSPCRGSAGHAARCEALHSGWETLCLRQRNTGYSVNGGYAEYVLGSGGVRRPGSRRHRSRSMPPR